MRPKIVERNKRSMLSTVGWHSVRSSQMRVLTDSSHADSWLIARVWSSPGEFRSGMLGRNTVRFILGVDGEARIETTDTEFVLPARHFVLLDAEASATTSNTEAWARCEWHLNAPVLEQTRIRSQFRRSLRMSPGMFGLTTAITNVVSTGRQYEAFPEQHVLVDMFSSVVMAATLEASNESTRLSPYRSGIVKEVHRAVETNYRDPRFTVKGLATEVSLSPDYLRHLLAEIGQSPRELIERRRVAAAPSILRSAPAPGKDTLDAAASGAGFTTVRRMQEAIARQAKRERDGEL